MCFLNLVGGTLGTKRMQSPRLLEDCWWFLKLEREWGRGKHLDEKVRQGDPTGHTSKPSTDLELRE